MSTGSAFDALDPLLQHKLRLGACVLLSKEETLSFAQLKQALAATDGNLGAQLTKLEGEGYLRMKKSFQDRKPVTTCRLTARGQKALTTHLDAIQRIVDMTS